MTYLSVPPESEPSTVDAPASSAGSSAPAAALTRGLRRPESTRDNRIVWRYLIPITAIHLAAGLALVPGLFSWTGVVLALVGLYVFGSLGINLGYHRLLTHRSFKCPRWLERIFVLLALCCLEDSPGRWAATHRLHHKVADEQSDPHTPLVSFLWAHVGWLIIQNRDLHHVSSYERYARDILRQPFYLKLERQWIPIWVYLGHTLLFFAGGFAGGCLQGGDAGAGLQLGLSCVVWGVLVRTVAVWHITWSVNSLTHLFGYQSHATGESSRNNWLVGLLANGEGWHNNHHAFPASATNWHRWWEIDVVYVTIALLEKLGLAWDVVRPRKVTGANPPTPA